MPLKRSKRSLNDTILAFNQVPIESPDYLRRFLALPQEEIKPPLGSLVLDVTIRTKLVFRVLFDTGLTINVMPLKIFEAVGLGPIADLAPYKGTLLLADSEYARQPLGIACSVMCWVIDFLYPIDFVVMDTILRSHRDMVSHMILSLPFLKTARACIDYERDEVVLRCEGQFLRVHLRANREGYDRTAALGESIGPLCLDEGPPLRDSDSDCDVRGGVTWDEVSDEFCADYESKVVSNEFFREPEPKHFPIGNIYIDFDLEMGRLGESDPVSLSVVLDTGKV